MLLPGTPRLENRYALKIWQFPENEWGWIKCTFQATPATLSGEKANNSLSVSAPDLAARQRQQSSEASSELDNMLEAAEGKKNKEKNT